jgi:DNA repair exonuclease SbcCD ATPase subunit
MARILLTATLVLLACSTAFAQKGGQKNNDKANKEAQKKALEQQIHQLREQEKTQLKQMDEQFKAAISKIGHSDQQEKDLRARLEREEKEAMKRIDERFHHIIHNLEPKQVRHQLEEILGTLRRVHEIISEGNFDYGGNRHAAQVSIAAAEHQIKHALAHDTHEERAKAFRDMQAAHRDIEKALAYSLQKYGLGNGKGDKGEPETRAAANRQLVEALTAIDNTEHLLGAVDHEIKDYEQEKRALLAKKEEVKKKVHAEFEAKIKQLSEEVHKGHEMKHQLAQKHEADKKKVKEHFGAMIKDLEQKIKQIK